jgi:hypothetical protein
MPRDLSYPELIPEPYYEACLYEDFEGLLARLRHALEDIQATRAFSLRESMARFDWRRMAPIYDERLIGVAHPPP